jgi:hypothetical protein
VALGPGFFSTTAIVVNDGSQIGKDVGRPAGSRMHPSATPDDLQHYWIGAVDPLLVRLMLANQRPR